MAKKNTLTDYTNIQAFLLVALRVLIGWYFLYEGIIKIINPDWTCYNYLMDSQGPFAGLYHSMAANADLVSAFNFLNMWGLTFIGLGLIAGMFSQLALFSGMLILIIYFCSHPALASVTYAMPTEGSYLWVNKTLLEIFTMLVLMVFPTSHIVGIDRFFTKHIKN